MNIWRSDCFKSKQYTVELIDDSLYDWNVRLLLPSFDADSPLYTDLQQLKTQSGKEGVLLHIRFKDGYPIEPPFVRVVEPVINSELNVSLTRI
jgi:ubiquitin-conjugating enzyme E2 Q